ncbi:MAG: NAD(P)H-hydrate dehydratase [Prolixibacteraceae bacterium]|jgi:hydroxyethylthiazole kinase-like uncharacterized protein yjeF|nr:NAD(P)H-hydrate dehydratase [Prolixibacteraceae bacterium]
MKIFATNQISKIDQYTIEHEPVPAINLMERASMTVVDYLVNETDVVGRVMIFCGPGNNGGDGLTVARLLSNIENRFDVSVHILNFGKELKGSASINLNRLINQQKVKIHFLKDQIPIIPKGVLVIDALFGSGLSRPLEGFPAELVQGLNQSEANILSIDIPSGLMGEDNTNNISENIIQAQKTITFQFPKISFLLPENEIFIGDWSVTDIGLHKDAINYFESKYYYLDDEVVTKLIKPRRKFSHKGTFGHALLISGAYGKMGAAILSSMACLRSGVGLLTTHVPHGGYQIIQNSVPEAMTSIDDSDLMFTGITKIENYSAIGIGPGIGTKVNTQRGLKQLIDSATKPMILDADALNILSENPVWLKLLPEHSILTPHPKELERMVGPSTNGFQRMTMARKLARKFKLIIVIKGAHTQIINPSGEVWFNSTGNPGMATAGSGDALTGIILGLLAQGHTAFDAAKIGVYVHGLAGDVAVARRGYEALIASDIINNLGEAFKIIHK